MQKIKRIQQKNKLQNIQGVCRSLLVNFIYEPGLNRAQLFGDAIAFDIRDPHDMAQRRRTPRSRRTKPTWAICGSTTSSKAPIPRTRVLALARTVLTFCLVFRSGLLVFCSLVFQTIIYKQKYLYIYIYKYIFIYKYIKI